MKRLITFAIAVVMTLSLVAQNFSYEYYALENEKNPTNVSLLKLKCLDNGLPFSVISESNGMIDIVAWENNNPVYAHIKNLHHPFDDAAIVGIDEVNYFIQTENVKVYYADGTTTGTYENIVQTSGKSIKSMSTVLFVLESTNDRIMAFDPYNGDLITDNFYQGTMGTTIDINVNSSGIIVISDQIQDVMFQHTAMSGVHSVFAPIGGADVSIMDNIRGFWVDDSDNYYVTVAAGTNAHSIVTFNSAGTYTGTFINPGQLQSPFDIIFRDNDVLITEVDGDFVRRFTPTGALLDTFLSAVLFPEQIFEDFNENIVTANFSGTPGAIIQQADGTLIKNITCLTGNRGVYMLGNGNMLLTNSSGVHEIDTLNDVVVRTQASGLSGRYIKEVNVQDILWPLVEMTPPTTPVLCNDSVLLRVTYHSLAEYEWLYNNVQIAVDVDSLWAHNSGNYKAIVGYKGVWADTLEMDVLSVYDNLDVTVIGNVVSVPDIYTDYQWYKNNAIIPGANSYSFTVTETGYYKCEVTFSPTCIEFSNEVLVTVTGLDLVESDPGITVMPNPFEDEIIVSFDFENAGQSEIVITDLTGRKLFSQSFVKSNHKHNEVLNLSMLSEGLYLISIYNNSELMGVKKILRK